MTKIGIIGAGTGALPSEVLRMAEEANVEIVELDKDFSPTDTPQFEDRVYTIQSRPEIPHIEWCEPVRFGKGGSKSGRSEKQIRKDRKKSKARKTHRRNKILRTSPKKFGDFLWIFEFIHYLCCVNQLKQ